MRVLIGTDVLLYYLLKQELEGISMIFKWIERLDATKYMDSSSIVILTNFVPLESFEELHGFEFLKGIRPKAHKIKELELKNKNIFCVNRTKYKPLLAQLNWLCYHDVDYLITENAISHKIAKLLEVDDKVFSIEEFIEKCSCLLYTSDAADEL